MPQRALAAILVFGIVTAARTTCAQSAGGETGRIGFGAAVSTGAAPVPTGASLGPVFLVPIDVSSWLRIEPEIGYSRASLSQTTTAPTFILSPPAGVIPVTSTTTSTQTTTATAVGTGIFFAQTRDRVRFHYGARVGYARTSNDGDSATVTGSRTSSSTSSTKLTGYFVGPAIGGEFFLADRFSLGAELEVRYTSLDGTQSLSVVPAPTPIVPPAVSASASVVQTRAAVVARLYVR